MLRLLELLDFFHQTSTSLLQQQQSRAVRPRQHNYVMYPLKTILNLAIYDCYIRCEVKIDRRAEV